MPPAVDFQASAFDAGDGAAYADSTTEEFTAERTGRLRRDR